MRSSEASPNGVKALSTLLVASEQVTPCWREAVGAGDAARHVVVGIAAHEEQVGGRQHGDGDTGVGELARDLDLALRGDGGQLGDMADGDAAAVAGEACLAHHLVEVHPAGVEIEIEVEVDVEIEAAGDGEDARDVLDRLGVGVRAAADQVGAFAAGLRSAAPRCRDR